jgi:hypothetical protein
MIVNTIRYAMGSYDSLATTGLNSLLLTFFLLPSSLFSSNQNPQKRKTLKLLLTAKFAPVARELGISRSFLFGADFCPAAPKNAKNPSY